MIQVIGFSFSWRVWRAECPNTFFECENVALHLTEDELCFLDVSPSVSMADFDFDLMLALTDGNLYQREARAV